MNITRSIVEPIRQNLNWDQRWKEIDLGLIACWERGREKSLEDTTMAAQARSGQLVILPWKGGVQKAVKKKQKYGTLYYFAMWQGLRGDDLSITLEEEITLTCSITKMNVVFTIDMKKYAGE